jgi:hypothetical protein
MGDQAFEFRVYNPEQRPGQGKLDLPYWVYHVRAKTSLSHYAQKEMEVVRRYSDFEWLRAQLCEEYVWCIVPPIPEKAVKGTIEKIVGGVHDPQLLEYRMRALRKFLVRLGSHPHLFNSALLKDFLEMDGPEWERRMKMPKKVEGKGLASTLTDAGAALAKQWSAASPASASAYAKALTEHQSSSQIWEETRGYVSQLETSITVLKERLDQLVKRRKETSSCLAEFGKAFARVGEIEKSMEQQLPQQVNSDATLSTALVAVGNHTEQLAVIYIEHADNETKQVVETLIYYSGLCAALKETLKRLQTLVGERDKANGRVKDAHAAVDKLMKQGTPEKVAAAQQELQAAMDRRDSLTKHVLNFEILFKEELRRFHREKQYDMKSMLKSFVELQLDYAAKMKRNWEGLLPAVEKVKI